MFRKDLRVVVLMKLAVLTVMAVQGQGQTASRAEMERFRLAADYSRENRGVAMLVMKGDQVVFDDNALDVLGDVPWIIASGTKSFSGVMCAAAIDDGLISGFDEKVAETITEWKTDPRKSKVTIRQLLTLTSGIDAGEIAAVPAYADAIGAPSTHDPGKHFEYGPVPFQIFGEVMTRKLRKKNESVKSYLKRRILDPIGMNVAYWRSFGDEPLLPQGLTLRAREWAKFGLLLKNRGKWNGRQLIKAELMDELVKGSKANPAYGITFWLNAEGTSPSGDGRPGISGDIGKKISGAANIYMAAGAGYQRLYVIPSQDLVVVRFGIFGKFDDREFIFKLLTGK